MIGSAIIPQAGGKRFLQFLLSLSIAWLTTLAQPVHGIRVGKSSEIPLPALPFL